MARTRRRAARSSRKRSAVGGCAAVLALAVSAPCAAAQASEGGGRCGDGLILVVEVDRQGADKELANLVAIRAEQGLSSGLEDAGLTTAALSLPGIRRRKEKVAPAIFELAKVGVSPAEAYEKVWQAARTQKLPFAGYVQITLRRTLEAVSAELELICLPGRGAAPPRGRPAPGQPLRKDVEGDGAPHASADAPDEASQAGSAPGKSGLSRPPAPPANAAAAKDGPLLAARKVVRFAGGSEEALLQAVFSAARRLAEGDHESPVVRIQGGGRRQVPVDAEVVVDASSSSDPDDDAIELEWRLGEQSKAVPECLGWHQEEGRLHFRASAPATCTFVVTAREVLNRDKWSGREVVIEALGKPRVRVSENQLVFAEGPKVVRLSGHCESCARWRWAQVSGPLLTEPVECNGGNEEPPTCEVRAGVAGEYSFALGGWNALGEDRKEYTVSVIPPPVPLAYVPRKAIVHHRYVLDGTSSHDTQGGELHYLWRVSRQDFPEQCESVPPRDDVPNVRLGAPTSPRTEFTSSEVARDLKVRLTVFTARTIGGRASSTVWCATRRLPVEPPKWLLALASGSDWEARDQSWRGTHASAVLSVRPEWRRMPWLGLRAEQNLVRNDGEGTNVIALGGSFFGVTALWVEWLHPYVSGYFRTWGRSALGVQVGADLRVQRFAFGSAGVRNEYRTSDGGWHRVVTATLGLGYDL